MKDPALKNSFLQLIASTMLSLIISGSAAAYIDNGDGTFSDLATGKMWLKDTECLGPANWSDAFTRVADFNTTNRSIYNCQEYSADYSDWYLPSSAELSTISFGPTNPAFILKGSNSDYQLWGSDSVPQDLPVPPFPENPAMIQEIIDSGAGNYTTGNQVIVDMALNYHLVPVRIYTDYCPSDPLKITPGICGCGIPDTDSDGDGVADCLDACPGFDDSIDADRDKSPDACDTFPADGREWLDSDADGVGDNADICPGANDSAQSDSDGVADGCDTFPTIAKEWKDSDSDGIGDNEDNCPTTYNTLQIDSDADAIGDSCDNSPNTGNFGSVLDAPHNHSRGIGCKECHSYSVWWQYSPSEQEEDYGTKADSICLTCHGSGAAAIQVHSASAIGPMHRSILGQWSSKCVDCHNPHRQEQLSWRNSRATDLYLITGSFGDNSTFSVNKGRTSFAYTLVDTNNSNWSDPLLWGNKDNSGYPSGLILVENTSDAVNSYEILGANATTITIKGGIDKSKAANGSFGLIYGRLIRSNISTPKSGPRDVTYFAPAIDSYVDLNIPTKGLCQICHEDTLYWTNDGLNSGHYSSTTCTNCHRPSLGFKSYEVDTTPPVVALLGSGSESTECGETYIDPGASITDNSSINLSAEVITPLDEFLVGVQRLFYSGQDNSGNSAVPVPRDVTVVDTTKPLLTLIGSTSVITAVGEPYVDAGASASDSCKITNQVITNGTVDVNTPGDYLLTYDVFDDAGNGADQISRTVTVGRWLDNGDGTVTDKSTGLVWLKDANCFGALNWDAGEAAAAALYDDNSTCGLDDGSLPGVWRQPTLGELSFFSNGVEAVRHDSPYAFANIPNLFPDPTFYWTSSETGVGDWVYYVDLNDGVYHYYIKTNTYFVLPVRDPSQ